MISAPDSVDWHRWFIQKIILLGVLTLCRQTNTFTIGTDRHISSEPAAAKKRLVLHAQVVCLFVFKSGAALSLQLFRLGKPNASRA